MVIQDIDVTPGAGDSGIVGGGKINANFDELDSRAAANSTAAATNAGAITGLDTRVSTLEGGGGGGGGSTGLVALAQNFDLDAATVSVAGTTFVTAGSTESAQYPFPDADKLYNVEISVSAVPQGSTIPAGQIVTRYVTSHSDTDTPQVFTSTRENGVSSPWYQLQEGLAPNLLTQDDRSRTNTQLTDDFGVRNVLSGGRYTVLQTAASTTADQYPPLATAQDVTWSMDVERVSDTEATIRAEAVYTDDLLAPRLQRWETRVALVSATAWAMPVWARPIDPTEIEFRVDFSENELHIIVGQSNGNGADLFKEDGVNQRPYDHEGADAPPQRAFEISHGPTPGSEFLPVPRAPQGELTGLRGYPSNGFFNAAQGRYSRSSIGHFFASERLDEHPGIKKLALSVRAVGATAMNQWVPGNGLPLNTGVERDRFTLTVNECNTFLADNPEFKVGSIIWVHGESDALAGRTQSQYEADLVSVAQGFRTAITGATGAPFIVTTMSKAWRDQDGTGAREAIHQAQLNAPNVVPNCAVVNLDDLVVVPNTAAFISATNGVNSDDVIHYGRDQIPSIGVRVASAVESLMDFREENGLAFYRMRYIPELGRYDNINSPGVGNIYDQRFEDDPDRGRVLSTETFAGSGVYEGFYTDFLHSTNEYTLAVRLRMKGTAGNSRSIMSHGDNSQGQAKLMTMNVVNHGQFADAPGTGYLSSIVFDQWVWVGLTFDGTNFQRYVNGQPDGAPFPPVASSPPFEAGQPGFIQLGTWQTNAAQQWEGLIDDVTVASRALGVAQMNALFRG